eukprot:CAMPEP_0204621656 /NCGR_PEP_ID=MMETSP0717-20131115/7305_1 /ASSEMBLY_ACC=CAM_ASM_000666 /TAXON_ID=230516 /ORGANISM="Chaetoceros curvisetus" /LENGTH=327 /DNA_ID=CAMNT_0051636115 /DNA_START=341 /DNA_END=1321 /DNA_ORIENTATION=+
MVSSLFIIRALSVFGPLAICFVNAFDVEPYPEFRFRPYNELTTGQKSAALALGYTPETWNQPGATDIEYISWWYNVNMDYYDWDGDGEYYEPNPAFLNAAKTLGFVGDSAEDVWDCWQNHYSYYEWSELVQWDIASSFEALGWTEAKWNEEDLTPPTSESKKYSQLTGAEKTAASALCYTQKIWDYEVLPFCLDKKGTVLGNTCHDMSLRIPKCFANKANWKHCPNTCGACDWDHSPVSPPVSPPTGPVTCKDDCSFRFPLRLDPNVKQGCRWFRLNWPQAEKRKKMYCSDPKILKACPATCNEQCANQSGFRYVLDWNGKDVGCGW